MDQTTDAGDGPVGDAGDARALRVFVSSTFRDMQLERDELVKRVFPQIRAMCERRGVHWSEIDLRWGVTDEQKAEGEVLPICLAEIERTRPYFIGLIGQRYGWVPDELPPSLVDRLGWLTDDLGRSVTELEILHGVLRRDGETTDAFFYLRDPAWVEALPADERGDFEEDSTDGRTRLAELRARIADSGHATSHYSDPGHLAELVLADLTELVERRFPEAEAPSARARADHVHEAFGRARFGLHLDRPEIVAHLDAHADGTAQPLLLTGESGVGVSSLATNWVWRWAQDHPDDLVVVHHVDADVDSADHRAMVARLVATIDPDGGPMEQLLGDLADAAPAELRSAITRASAAASGRTIVVLDGVDRLADVDAAPDLRWLPETLPPTLRLVLTASAERVSAAATRRDWPVVTVPRLTVDERREVARSVLAVWSKALDVEHLDALVSAPLTGNARFLRTVLDELRQHGDHFTLRPLIDRLCAAGSVDDLLELVLERYEADFDRDRAGLTRDVMTAIWAARHGLAETELREVVATVADDGTVDPLPQALWAPLHLAAEHGLVSRGGLLGFAHPDIERAVVDRYLPSSDDRRAAHGRLAAYFSSRPVSPRVVDELGWQQADSGDLDGLERTLADLEHVELAYRRNPADVRRLWARVSDDSVVVGDRMRVAYRRVIDDPSVFDVPSDGERRQLVWGVARLLADAGQTDPALRLQRYLVDSARGSIDAGADDGDVRLRAALVNLGASQLAVGELADADETFSEALDRCRSAGDDAMSSVVTSNLGIVRRERGRPAEADALFGESEALCRRLDDEFGLQALLGNHAQLHRESGDLDAALACLVEQERICRNLADPAAVARALLGQATVLADRGALVDSMVAMERSIEMCRSEGDLRGVVEALINLAVTAGQAGDAERAMSAGRDAEATARTLGDPGLLARALVTRAMQAAASGDWPESERLAREADLTARQAGLPRQRALALGAIGTARREQGDLAGSREAHEEELAQARVIDDSLSIATAQANLGNVAIATQDLRAALGFYAEAIAVFVDRDLPSMLLPVLANRAQIHQMEGRFPEALVDYTDAAEAAVRLGLADAVIQWAQPALQIGYQLGDTARVERLWATMEFAARAAGDDDGLQRALGERAVMIIGRAQQDPGALDEAAALLDEQHAICIRTANDVGLAACVGNQAIVERYRGNLERSLAHLDEQLAISRRSNNAQSVLFATANRGEVLGLLGRRQEALAELSQARATAQQYGLAPMVQQLDQMIAGLG